MRNGLSNDLRALSPKSCSQPTVVIILEMAMTAMIGTNAVMITVIMLKTLTTLYMAGLVGAPGDENVDCAGWRE